jgi:hypothetical protein
VLGGLGIAGASFVAASAVAAPTEPGELQNPLETPDTCAECHAFANAAGHAGDPNYSPIGWQGSPMANAARDPVFWAGVAIAAQDAPGETEDCVRCHAPRAFLDGRGDAIALSDLEPADRTGVDCDLCHRMIDDGQTPAGNARYTVDDAAVAGKVPKRGPWSYGVDVPPHPWSGPDAFLAQSRLCGTCHDVTTNRERVDDEGVEMGIGFNEQRTYREWQNSVYALPGPDAKTCQDCHLPAVSDAAGCGIFEGEGKAHPAGVRRHELVGANRFLLQLLAATYGDAGTGEVGDEFFDYSTERLDALVATAATLEVEFPAAVDVGEGIPALPVRVGNETGHKLPTGYSEGRVMWIEVVASYRGDPVWTSGAWDGQSIEADPQVRRYEAIAEAFEDQATFHLLRNDHWVVDSRIPPRGLKADIETDPVGDRWVFDGQAWPSTDEVSYAFAPVELQDQTPPDDDDELSISVRLLYLVNTPEYIDFLAEENATNSAGTEVADLFEQLGGAPPVVLAEASATVPLSGLTPAATEETASASSGSEPGEGTTAGQTGETGSEGSSDGPGGCACGIAGGRAGSLAAGWLGLSAFRRRRAPARPSARARRSRSSSG